MKQVIVPLLALVLFSGSFAQAAPPQPAHPQPKKADIYDTKANGAKQIEVALAEAKKNRKRVLLQFGANWCGWCHLLHELCDSNKEIAGILKKNYVVVLIDVDKGHNTDINTKYGNPIQHGLPVIVVLDSNGKQLFTQDTGKLEEGNHHDPAKVIEFLKKWAPKS